MARYADMRGGYAQLANMSPSIDYGAEQHEKEVPMKPATVTKSRPLARTRGGNDAALALALGRAIRAAMADDMSAAELARRTDIDQPTLSKLIRGVRISPLNIWEMLAIEHATNRPAGWLLQHAGLMAATPSAVVALSSEPGLSAPVRRVLVAALEAALDDRKGK